MSLALTRRQFLASTAAVSVMGLSASPSLAAVSVHEITMADPYNVCVEVRDPPVVLGTIKELTSPDSGDFNKWVKRDGTYACVIGPAKMHLRTQDTRSTVYLDRAAADVAADYGQIGGLTVTNVFRKTTPYSSGASTGATSAVVYATKCTSSKHFLFLQLSGRLPPGTHKITFPPGTKIPPATFTFDDTKTRALALHVNQVGHRPSDSSKLAYLALWKPGGSNEGAVDFASLGFKEFDIIDETGARVWGPAPIVQRIGPTDPEHGSGYVPNNICGGYPPRDGFVQNSSASQPTIKIKAISNAKPGVVTTNGPHGLQNGDIVRLYFCGYSGYGGMYELNNLTVKVQNITTDTFAMQQFTTAWTDLDTTTFHAYADGIKAGEVYKTISTNRAGTFVYGLNYSSFNKPGTFYLRIPGLGISDPVRIDDRVWYDAAWASAKGEYHHRWGTALDGRFGFTRPTNFDGVSKTIYESNLPYLITNLGGQVANVVGVGAGAAAPWIRRTTVKFGGSWTDAGDWVQRLAGITDSCFNYLDLCEQIPDVAETTAFDLPKSSQVLDPELYAGTDSLPEMVHQAIWGLDTYRRTQYGPGSVFGPGAVPGGLGMTCDTGTTEPEPSWLYRDTAYTYAPDHWSNFNYAGAAAKLATLLYRHGFTTAAEVWKASAIAAWNWAEAIHLDANGEFDAYYKGVLNIQSNAGWTDDQYATNKTRYIPAAVVGARMFAAACLYRLTGEIGYRIKFEKYWPIDVIGAQGSAAWEYLQVSPSRRNSAVSAQITNAIVTRALTNIVGYSEGKIAYRSIQWKNQTPFNFGSCGTDLSDMGPNLVRAHKLTRDKRYLQTLQSGLAFIYGANQMSMSFTQGVGVRWPGAIFNSDSYSMGVETPIGISCYGFYMLGAWFVTPLNFGTGWFNWIVECPDAQFAADFELQRTQDPKRYCLPIYEAIHESPYVLCQTERSVQQNVLPLQYCAMYLHGWDSNARSGSAPR